MAAVVARSSQLSPTIPVQEKGSRNKRKFRADPPFVSCSDCDPNIDNGTSDLNNCSSSMVEFPNYQISDGKSENDLCLGKGNCCNMCGAGIQRIDLVKPASQAPRAGLAYNEFLPRQEFQEELDVNEFQDADWSELTEAELEELVLNNLDTIYQSAIKRIASSGFTLDVAKQAVLRCWRCYGTKDPVSSIVDNVLAFLKNGQEMDSKDHPFQDLPQLEKHILDEMVCVLREMRPFFSVGDALWCLLICDMNIAHACAVDTDAIPCFGNVENAEAPPVSIVPQRKNVMHEISSASGSNSNQPNEGCAPPSLMPIVGGIPNLPPARFPSSSNMSCTNRKSEISVSSERLPNEPMSSSCLPLSPRPKDEELVRGSNNSSFCLPQESSGTCREQVTSAPQISLPDAKYALEAYRPDSYRKHHLNNFKRVHFRQKCGQAENSHQGNGAKASSKSSKNNKLGEAVLDRKWNLESNSSATTVKCPPQSYAFPGLGIPPLAPHTGKLNFVSNAGLSANAGVVQNTMNLPMSCPMIPINLPLLLPSKGNEALESNKKVLDDKREVATCGCPHRLPCEIFGQSVLPDAKDEKLLQLVHHARTLQSQLQQWTEWAQQKVMQAARRLSKDKAELKSLRQEKEEAVRMIKERQMLEENTLKKLSDMEAAIIKTSAHLGYATGATHRLEVENRELWKGMEAAKACAEEAAANCLEVLRREEETLRKINSCERQKELIQEELATERRKQSQLQQQLLQAKECLVTTEDKWRQENKAKEEALMRVNSEKEERRQLEHTSKSKEDGIRMKAERDYQQYRDDIRRLENEITELRLKTDSSKIAALRWGTDRSYASRLTDNKCTKKRKDSDQQLVCDVGDFQDSSVGDVQRNRECVMCLTEEMSVVFLPCAHQVVCMNCNQLHEKQGMMDCPSCRAPILQRICVRFVNS